MANARFWALVDKTGQDGCWLWLGPKNQGYGVFQVNRRRFKAHRYSLLLAGETPNPGEVAGHKCRNRNCVNPAHLAFVSARENALVNNSGPVARNSLKTHCKHGHELTPDNCTRFNLKRGYRECKTCKSISQRLWKDRQLSSSAAPVVAALRVSIPFAKTMNR